MKSKEELRREGLKQRSRMPEKEGEEKSREIQEKILDIIDEEDTVMTYASYKNEVETDLLIKKLLQKNQTLATPKTSGDEMKAYVIESKENLRENSQGIREPHEGEKISKASIDVCIVPGVKFDRQGNRIGYGKGYYDRFLDNFKGHKIGIIYEQFLVDNLPNREWDIPMDKIVTERETVLVESRL